MKITKTVDAHRPEMPKANRDMVIYYKDRILAVERNVMPVEVGYIIWPTGWDTPFVVIDVQEHREHFEVDVEPQSKIG